MKHVSHIFDVYVFSNDSEDLLIYFHYKNVASITYIADVNEYYGFLPLGAVLFENVERHALQAHNSSYMVVVCRLGRFYVMMILLTEFTCVCGSRVVYHSFLGNLHNLRDLCNI